MMGECRGCQKDHTHKGCERRHVALICWPPGECGRTIVHTKPRMDKMNDRYLALILIALLAPVSAWAQSGPLPRTPDGKPDLGGYWNLPQTLRVTGHLAQ